MAQLPLLVLALFLSFVGPPQTTRQPIDPVAAAAALEQLEKCLAFDRGSLWDFSLVGPMLFVDPGTRAVVTNRQWKLADSPCVLDDQYALWSGHYSPTLPLANTSVQWADQRWAMLLWPLPDEPSARLRLMLHESFHREQAALGLPQVEVPCAHLDSRDGRLWMRLEFRALARALRTTGLDSAEAIEDAVAFRAERGALGPAGRVAQEERLVELNEGLAEYTAYALYADRTVKPPVLGWGGAARRAAAADALDRAHAKPSYTRSFAYATGPALGLLLDLARPEWRTELTAELGPADLMADAFPVPFAEELPPELELPAGSRSAADALTRAEAYGYDELVAEEDERELRRVERQLAWRARFVEGPRMIVPASRPQYSFDPSRKAPLEGAGTVYEGNFSVTDAWGSFEAGSGVLWSDAGAFHLPGPVTLSRNGRSASGDGWSLDLADGWQIHSGPLTGSYAVGR